MRLIIGSAVVLGVAALACADAPRAEADRGRGDSAGHVAAAQPITRDDGRGARRCNDIDGFLNDPTPGGRVVYAAPDTGSRVLGRIAEPLPEANGGWAVGFAIDSTRDGWLRIDRAGDDPQLSEGVERPMYHGAGWIRGTGVYVGFQAAQGFAEPRHSSEIIMQVLDGGGLGGAPAALRAIVACDGKWVLGRWEIVDSAKVRYDAAAVVSREPLMVEAWATGICNIPETSCDGLNGDRPDSVQPAPRAAAPANAPPGSG